MELVNIIFIALLVILIQSLIFEIYEYIINRDLHKQWKAEHDNFERGFKKYE